MAKSIPELEKEIYDLQQQLNQLPPSYSANTFPQRNYLIRQAQDLRQQLNILQIQLAEARANNAALLEKIAARTNEPANDTNTDTEDVIDLVENSEEDIVEEEE